MFWFSKDELMMRLDNQDLEKHVRGESMLFDTSCQSGDLPLKSGPRVPNAITLPLSQRLLLPKQHIETCGDHTVLKHYHLKFKHTELTN